MGFNCGIVGLPNVGKSTIFNALTAAGAQAANYPFCTIEPNTGVVSVPDPRLDILAKVAGSAKIVPTVVEFLDIAGLVKGASKGEGLGNQFLGHIRSVDAIVHVVRCFEDDNITHVYDDVSPVRDIEIIETELVLADLAVVEKKIERIQKGAKLGDKALAAEQEILGQAKAKLSAGDNLRGIVDPEGFLSKLELLTLKPVLFVANVDESQVAMKGDDSAHGLVKEVVEEARKRGSEVVVMCGKVEEEISQLPMSERAEFLSALGLTSSGLDRLALTGYNLLNLITFFTIGPKEAHAWTCVRNASIVEASSKIHTDFAKGFIRAEVISYKDFVQYGGEVGAREKGLLRIEGKTYTTQDGDIVHIRFNV